MTETEAMIVRGNANLAKMNLNADQHNEHLFLPTAIIDGAITGGTAMGGGVDLRGWTQKAEPPIPPAEPTRKRAEAVKGKCKHCGEHYSRHKESGGMRVCLNAKGYVEEFEPGEPPAPAAAASTKQEGGAGCLSDEQIKKIGQLAQSAADAALERDRSAAHYNLRYERAVDAFQDYLNGLRAKDAR